MIGQFKGRQKTNVYGWVSDLAVARSGFNQIDHTFSVNVKIVFKTNEKVQKINISYN